MRTAPVAQRSVRGFTLVEMLVAMAVFTITIGGVYDLLATQAQSSRLTNNFLQVQQNARYAMERIVEEARWADYITATATSVEIHVPQNNAVQSTDYCAKYILSGTKVTRAAGASGGSAPAASEVAQDITAFSPTWSSNQLTITITATAGSQTRTFTTTVFPRNLLQSTNPCAW